MQMHVINVVNDYDPQAEMICECGVWKSQANTDIEIMAKCINHIREAHPQQEGVINFPRRFIVITDTSVTILDKGV